MPVLDPPAANKLIKGRIFTPPRPDQKQTANAQADPSNQGNIHRMRVRRGRGSRLTDLGGEDGEVDAGEALEVLLEEALGVVLPDLLARHGWCSESREVLVGLGGVEGGRVGDWRWACRGARQCETGEEHKMLCYIESGLDGI